MKSTVSLLLLAALGQVDAARLPAFMKRGPAPPPLGTLVEGYEYQGCYFDSSSLRTLNKKFIDSNSMTPSYCVRSCKALGYQLAGLE